MSASLFPPESGFHGPLPEAHPERDAYVHWLGARLVQNHQKLHTWVLHGRGFARFHNVISGCPVRTIAVLNPDYGVSMQVLPKNLVVYDVVQLDEGAVPHPVTVEVVADQQAQEYLEFEQRWRMGEDYSTRVTPVYLTKADAKREIKRFEETRDPIERYL